MEQIDQIESTINKDEDYSSLLKTFGIDIIPSEYYWLIGEIKAVQGWILHLSVIRSQIPDLINAIAPYLISQNIAFKVIRDRNTAAAMAEGNLGSNNIGKTVCIYPNKTEQYKEIINELTKLTAEFRGPRIPTDYHLKGILYTRYGSFNPIIQLSPEGQRNKFIYNSEGELTQDLYTIPFSLPPGISWPFQDIKPYEIKKLPKLLNYAYYPIATIKPDAKGDVLRAVYFKSLFKIKSCLIKQGRKNTFCDDFGRDIQDRLKWQYDLYKDIEGKIPIPKIFDLFEFNEDTYLAMEFIKGNSFAKYISMAFHERCWKYLHKKSKLQLLEPILTIIGIIKNLHQLGYIHRDITPENFLIDNHDNIYLIDMELTWSVKEHKPTPPFRQGTPGFMSPEQEMSKTPTAKEDIYGLGGIMIVLFTNLSPTKFQGQTFETLKASLSFFINDIIISDLIARCWHSSPEMRPSIIHLKEVLEIYHQKTSTESTERLQFNDEPLPSNDELLAISQLAIIGLSYPELLSSGHHWLSKIRREETLIGNEQLEMTIYPGWHTGLAGPLYLLARARQCGLNIDSCKVAYFSSWDYIQDTYFSDPLNASEGLYHGGAGIAIALAEGLKSGLLLLDEDSENLIASCFSKVSSSINLSTGVAGQGLALLHTSEWLKEEQVTRLTSIYINNIISAQHPSGFWSTGIDNKSKKAISPDIDEGIAGILLFLLLYIEKFDNPTARLSAEKGIHWLTKGLQINEEIYYWSSTKKSHPDTSYNSQVAGIILVFLKASQVLKKELYLKIAEDCISNIRPTIVLKNATLGNGMTGLGELYMEAYKLTGNEQYKKRAGWIASVILKTFNEREIIGGFWQADSNIETVDLFAGNSGIIHFLLHYNYPDKIKHPLLPY